MMKVRFSSPSLLFFFFSFLYVSKLPIEEGLFSCQTECTGTSRAVTSGKSDSDRLLCRMEFLVS